MRPRSPCGPRAPSDSGAQSGSGVAEASQKAKVKGGPNKILSEPIDSSGRTIQAFMALDVERVLR